MCFNQTIILKITSEITVTFNHDYRQILHRNPPPTHMLSHKHAHTFREGQ